MSAKKLRLAAKTTYFYILRCRDGSFYCGVTTDLARREAAHNAGRGSAYVRSRGGGKVVYSERFRKIGNALRREAAVKKWPRADKLKLIRSGTARYRRAGAVTLAKAMTPHP